MNRGRVGSPSVRTERLWPTLPNFFLLGQKGRNNSDVQIVFGHPCVLSLGGGMGTVANLILHLYDMVSAVVPG